MGFEESETWTTENLQRLLATLKDNIPTAERSTIYSKALKRIDWNKVAFPPFSPAECEQKWEHILHKMRKIRSLTELITEAEDVISNPNKNKKIHPEVPKKPSPPNALYFEQNRTRLQEQHPEMSSTLLLKLSTQMYMGLSDKERAPYVKKFNHARKEYQKQMLEFRERHGKPSSRYLRNYQNTSLSAGTQDKEGEDAGGVLRMPPRNGYNLFCREQKNMTGLPRRSCMAQWAQRWAELDASERKMYSERCKMLKLEHTTKLRGYLQRCDKEEQALLKKPGNQKTTKMSAFIRGEPKVPPLSGNSIFCQQQMKLLKEKIPETCQRFAEANKMWKKLSTKEKEHYKEIVNKSMKKYWTDLQKWFDTLTSDQQAEYMKHRPNQRQYLTRKLSNKEEPHLPSDSEDEDIVDSSSDEEENMEWNEDEDEEEEEEDDIMFEFD